MSTPDEAPSEEWGDATKLRALAEWHDLYDASSGVTSHEVQDDLRSMATRFEADDQLIADLIDRQRTPCTHDGIGLPGCATCDPRVSRR